MWRTPTRRRIGRRTVSSNGLKRCNRARQIQSAMFQSDPGGLQLLAFPSCTFVPFVVIGFTLCSLCPLWLTPLSAACIRLEINEQFALGIHADRTTQTAQPKRSTRDPELPGCPALSSC